MPILLKLFLLLINIDQETILNFFGVQDPNNFGDTSFSDLSEVAPVVSTDVSIETLKLVFEGLLERYQNGLGLVDFENIILFIIVIRFIILALKYNIKTSFYICCIGLVAGGLWYFHLKDLFLWYRDVLLLNRLTTRFVEESRALEIIDHAKRDEVAQTLKNPISYVKYALVEAGRRNDYHIDPISMLFTQVPESFRVQTDKFYFIVFGKLIPTIWVFLRSQVGEYIPIVTYLVVVRLNKRLCPYLIRWHWTFLWTLSAVENIYVQMVRRLQYYLYQVVIPEDKYIEQPIILGLLVGFALIHFMIIIFGLLHASCGQYFYFPFLVENAEIHIGPRPKNSIYSGGYTSWQNNKDKRIAWMVRGGKNAWQLYFPRLWWGWFGRGGSSIDNEARNTERAYRAKRRKRFLDKRKKRFNKIIRKLQKWIFKK